MLNNIKTKNKQINASIHLTTFATRALLGGNYNSLVNCMGVSRQTSERQADYKWCISTYVA